MPFESGVHVLRQGRKKRSLLDYGYHGYRWRTRTRRKRAVEGAVSPSVAVETISAGLKTLLCHPGHSLGDQDILSESLLLKKLKCSYGRTRVAGTKSMNTSHVARSKKVDLRQIFDVFWLCKVLEVGEVCNELWIVQQLLGG